MDNDMSKKVHKKFVKETIDEYHKSILNLNESATQYNTIEINGSLYYDVDMSAEELFKLKNATDMNDFQWNVKKA